jgi:uncharacterized protein (DUF885 family)
MNWNRKSHVKSLLISTFLFTSALIAEPLEPKRALSSVPISYTTSETTESLYKLFDRYWDFLLEEYPENATVFGFPGKTWLWTDFSPASIEKRKILILDMQKDLLGIDAEQLSTSDLLNYRILSNQFKRLEESFAFPSEYLMINQLDGIHLQIPELIKMMPTNTLSDYDDILARLSGIPSLLDQVILLLENGIKENITPPQVTFPPVLDQILSQITKNSTSSVYFYPFSKFPPSIVSKDQEEITQRAKQVIERQVFPSLKKLHTYLANVYLPHCRTSTAFSALPNGMAWYAQKVHEYTNSSLTPEKIHKIGLEEIQRIQKEIINLVAKLDFPGNLNDFYIFINSDPAFFYKDPQELLNGYRELKARIETNLPLLFLKIPKLPCKVVPVPSYAEQSQVTAYYSSGSVETDRPGHFYVNTFNLKSRPKWEMQALTLHEALPGHHFQVSVAQELQNVPLFRKYYIDLPSYTSFIEGWGLYSESLGKELGLYKDPYSEIGKLLYEMLRSVRLVVDTGLHALGWTRQEAIDFFRSYCQWEEKEVAIEIDRYLVIPGQALAYKIGDLKIKELRSLAHAKLKDRFDIRNFHDTVLKNGAVSLDILEEEVEKWCESVQANL